MSPKFMRKRVIVVHGWDGYPEEGWFPWLKKELESKGFDVAIPQFPDPGSPRIQRWVPKLSETVGAADSQTYFVGHSMGCQAIVRYLERLPETVVVGGAVFVAGFFQRLTNLGDAPHVVETQKHWLEMPLDFSKVRSHLPKSVAIFSDNDPWVPLENQESFRNQIGSEIVTEHTKGHFSGSRDGTRELPIVLEKILALSNPSSNDQ